jgi:hypothetical protein
MIDLFGYQGITGLEFMLSMLTTQELLLCDRYCLIEYRTHRTEQLYLDLLGCLDSELL